MGTTHLGAPGGGGAPWWVVPSQVPRSGGSWLQNFSFIFFLPEREYIELELTSVESQGAHDAGGAPCTLVDRVWAPDANSFTSIFY